MAPEAVPAEDGIEAAPPELEPAASEPGRGTDKAHERWLRRSVRGEAPRAGDVFTNGGDPDVPIRSCGGRGAPPLAVRGDGGGGRRGAIPRGGAPAGPFRNASVAWLEVDLGGLEDEVPRRDIEVDIARFERSAASREEHPVFVLPADETGTAASSVEIPPLGGRSPSLPRANSRRWPPGRASPT